MTIYIIFCSLFTKPYDMRAGAILGCKFGRRWSTAGCAAG